MSVTIAYWRMCHPKQFSTNIVIVVLVLKMFFIFFKYEVIDGVTTFVQLNLCAIR